MIITKVWSEPIANDKSCAKTMTSGSALKSYAHAPLSEAPKVKPALNMRSVSATKQVGFRIFTRIHTVCRIF